MFVLNYVMLFIIIILIAFLLQRYYEKLEMEKHKHGYRSIHQYLLSETSLAKNTKPIIWIHVPYEYNSRDWTDFGARSSFELNQPYLYLTIESIIKNCENDFYICIIDDHSFSKIIPEWNINMEIIADPILSNIRKLALAKTIYIYGGMVVPISFLCFQGLSDIYYKGIRNNKAFICENVNDNVSSTEYQFFPDIAFMGAKKYNQTINELVEYMQINISNDSTSQLDFVGDFNKWCNIKVNNKEINIIDGKEIGVKTLDDEMVLVDNLLNDNYINFYKNMSGIWIPNTQILNRRKYSWFAQLSKEQVLTANTILSKYIIIALSPDSESGVVEVKEQPVANWINFWSVPSDAPVYGLKPNYLGDNVQTIKL